MTKKVYPPGKLANKYCDSDIPISVCNSAAGYYIGVVSDFGEPISRESEEYYRFHVEAVDALENNTWTQRLNP